MPRFSDDGAMPSLAGFAAFARKVGVVPPVPQAPQTWGTGSEPGNIQYLQSLSNPVPHVPHVPPESDEGWDEEDWRAAFDERAGILEYDEGMTRAEAEALAREQVFGQRPDVQTERLTMARGTIVPFEKWRHDRKLNVAPVTVFNVSAISQGVKASAGPLVSLTDAPEAQYARYVVAKQISGKYVLGTGGPWPYWLVVIEGDHTGADFPKDPAAFDAWFPSWAQASGVRVIGDWRDEFQVGSREGDGDA